MDWDSHLAPIYAVDGSDATLALPAGVTPVRALDFTAGIDIGFGIALQGDIRPVAFVMAAAMAELGLEADQLVGLPLTLNGTAWRITAAHPKPVQGKGSGEYMLVLINEAAA